MKNFIFTSTIKPSICDRLIDLYESGLNTLGKPKVNGGMLGDKINFKQKKCKESYYDPYFLEFYLKEAGLIQPGVASNPVYNEFTPDARR